MRPGRLVTPPTDKRVSDARRDLLMWRVSAVPAGILSAGAGLEAWRAGEPWAAALLIFLVGISIWTGIATAHARLNADLPTNDDEGKEE